jgi:hypothetical protein
MIRSKTLRIYKFHSNTDHILISSYKLSEEETTGIHIPYRNCHHSLPLLHLYELRYTIIFKYGEGT